MNILAIVKHVSILRDKASPRDLPGIITALKFLLWIKDETKEENNPYIEIEKLKNRISDLKAKHYSELKEMTERFEHADDARIQYQRRLIKLKEVVSIQYVDEGFTPVEVNIGDFHFNFRINMNKQHFEDLYEEAVKNVTARKIKGARNPTLKDRITSYYTNLGYIVKDIK